MTWQTSDQHAQESIVEPNPQIASITCASRFGLQAEPADTQLQATPCTRLLGELDELASQLSALDCCAGTTTDADESPDAVRSNRKLAKLANVGNVG